MQYSFPPDLNEVVRSLLATGEYANEDDVLREAFRALERQSGSIGVDQIALEGIRRGLDDMKTGRVQEWSEFEAEFLATRRILGDE